MVTCNIFVEAKNNYEPIYFRYENENTEFCVLDTRNAFVNNTIEVIKENIKTNLLEKDYKFSLSNTMNILNKSKYKPSTFIVNPFNKISHIITNNNYIIPIIPNGIVEYEKINFIYEWNNVELQLYNVTINYLKKIGMDIKGIIVEDNIVVNILLKENIYVPIKPVDYDKKKHKYSISGTNNLLNIDININDNKKDSRIIF